MKNIDVAQEGNEVNSTGHVLIIFVSEFLYEEYSAPSFNGRVVSWNLNLFVL